MLEIMMIFDVYFELIAEIKVVSTTKAKQFDIFTYFSCLDFHSTDTDQVSSIDFAYRC